MVENKTAFMDQLFASNIKIVRFIWVHCLFDMNCDCLRNVKLKQSQPSKYQLRDTNKIELPCFLISLSAYHQG